MAKSRTKPRSKLAKQLRSMYLSAIHEREFLRALVKRLNAAGQTIAMHSKAEPRGIKSLADLGLAVGIDPNSQGRQELMDAVRRVELEAVESRARGSGAQAPIEPGKTQGKAVGDQVLRALERLGRCNITEIGDATGLGRNTVKTQIEIHREAGVVEAIGIVGKKGCTYKIAQSESQSA